MDDINKANKFLAFWIAIPTFFNYAAYFFPKSLKLFFLAPQGMFVFSIIFYLAFVFLRRPKIPSIPEMRYLIMLLVILCVGLLYTNAINYGSEKIIVLYTWITLFFLYAPIIVNNFEVYVKASLLCGAVFLLLLFTSFGDPISFFKSMQGEVFRLGYDVGAEEYGGLNPIWIARYLGFLFILALFIVKKRSSNFFIYGYMLLLFLYMITAGSKGPIVAMIGGSIVFLASENISSSLKTLFFIALIIVILVLLLNTVDFFSSQFFIDRFSSKSTSAEEREEFIDLALHFFGVLSFLFGTGTGNFGYLAYHRDTREYPHNIVVELYFENGVISLVLLTLIYISVIKNYRLISKSPKMRLLFAMFIYFALNSMFSGDLLGNEYFFIFFMLFHFEKLMIKETEQFELQLNQSNSDSSAYSK